MPVVVTGRCEGRSIVVNDDQAWATCSGECSSDGILALDEFVALVRQNDIMPRADGKSDDELLAADVDSLALLELLIMIESMSVSVNFDEPAELARMRSLRDVYLHYLACTHMPQSHQR